jgi:hypothetical protein
MRWKRFSLQRMLDVLFDDAWCQFGLPDAPEAMAIGVDDLFQATAITYPESACGSA